MWIILGPISNEGFVSLLQVPFSCLLTCQVIFGLYTVELYCGQAQVCQLPLRVFSFALGGT